MPEPTRRRFLSMAGTAATAGLAGCSEDVTDGELETPTPTSTPNQQQAPGVGPDGDDIRVVDSEMVETEARVGVSATVTNYGRTDAYAYLYFELVGDGLGGESEVVASAYHSIVVNAGADVDVGHFWEKPVDDDAVSNGYNVWEISEQAYTNR